ncbi:Eukaryotic translation initiation factor 2-alpha kinase 3 [Homalodisca vitripennis]|nr:Eukaryotic translation initiation factor 2-alpha kinase 3 [Homalodisca vitripennis]
MLSSSIHRLELTNNGQWVRMIPSLSGGLYKFNGEHIEAIPVTADKLLRSSFRYSEDLVISDKISTKKSSLTQPGDQRLKSDFQTTTNGRADGLLARTGSLSGHPYKQQPRGKESRTYGVEVDTGRVLYECTMGGCDNLTEAEVVGDVVLVQRQTQTVRAVEPRTGIEKWNFSVGQHELKVAPGPQIGCYSNPSQQPLSDVQLKVIVPEGLVCAVSKSSPGRVLWSHKFDSPVVSAWQMGQSQVEDVDLFSGTHPPLGPDEEPLPSSPALYVGMHQKQLYIQESVSMQQKLYELAASYRHHLVNDERSFPQIPWKPIPVTSTAVGLPSPDPEVAADMEDSNQTTAIAVLYASEYVNGNGYFLYSKQEPRRGTLVTLCPANDTNNNTGKEEIPVIESPDEIVFTHNQIYVVSLWFWWREILVISGVTATLVLLIQYRLQAFNIPTSQIILVKESQPTYSSQMSNQDTVVTSLSTLPLRPSDSFESRFLSDFIPVHCLGKGGFGVVFEARNKIDDCHYAIKRIPLPNSEESRERVMREVKALAKLDHQNIVRYFNAWLECPPPGWQEKQDQAWQNTRGAASSNGDAFTVDLTGQVTPDSERSAGNVINRSRLKPLSLWQSPDGLSESSGLPPVPCSGDTDNDSFIVFGSPSREVSKVDDDVFEEIEVKDEKLESAITVGTDTSMDTNTDQTDVEETNNPPKRPNTLSLDTKSGNVCASRMYLFIQMQLCKKESLKDWLKDNIHERPRMAVINIFDQIVQAVEYVHMQGLIHRDLKPSNIFFSPDGQVKVGDFGLVTAMAESPADLWVSVETDLDSWVDERHTARVGTQLYMSPEQNPSYPASVLPHLGLSGHFPQANIEIYLPRLADAQLHALVGLSGRIVIRPGAWSRGDRI